MPADRRAQAQLAVLLLALPVQYLVTHYVSFTSESRNAEVRRLLTSAVNIKNTYLSFSKWREWCVGLWSKPTSGRTVVASSDAPVKPNAPQSAASQNDYFATSKVPRSPRPPHVKYRIGQVIRHRHHGYRGVIIGWDETAKAPEKWLKQMHPPGKQEAWATQPNYLLLMDTRQSLITMHYYIHEDDIEPIEAGQHWRRFPNYSVLVDIKDRPQAQTTYVAEDNVEVISNTQVIHPEIEDFFEHFDGAQYIPRPWLREQYPHD